MQGISRNRVVFLAEDNWGADMFPSRSIFSVASRFGRPLGLALAPFSLISFSLAMILASVSIPAASARLSRPGAGQPVGTPAASGGAPASSATFGLDPSGSALAGGGIFGWSMTGVPAVLASSPMA
jgi:hypothetical protein